MQVNCNIYIVTIPLGVSLFEFVFENNKSVFSQILLYSKLACLTLSISDDVALSDDPGIRANFGGIMMTLTVGTVHFL